MNRQEQKERLTDIIDKIEDVESMLNNVSKTLQETFDKIDELENAIGNVIGDYSDYYDSNTLKANVLNTYIEENIELESIYDDLYEFKSELDEHMENLNDRQRESLEERYSALDETIERLNFDILGNESTIEDILFELGESKVDLKEMKK